LPLANMGIRVVISIEIEGLFYLRGSGCADNNKSWHNSLFEQGAQFHLSRRAAALPAVLHCGHG
jgi:hypothetical protein